MVPYVESVGTPSRTAWDELNTSMSTDTYKYQDKTGQGILSE